MKYRLLLVIAIFVISRTSGSEKDKPGFAVVVDQKSYLAAKVEIDAYMLSVERQGLKTFCLAEEWKSPEAIRQKLKELHDSEVNPLEGAVFIGDVPVPMIRDAQHFTSAFKMDQDRYPWHRSSIPSDRYYEDFDLKFNYLKRDTLYPLYYYFSLKAESSQRITPDIYSARIKPPEGPGKYDLLKAYLKKVVAYKENPQKVDQILFFTGHGYNSEDPLTWMDEKAAIAQQFSYLNGQQNFLEYISFRDEDHIKFRLMAELKRNDLDIALLHDHGGPTEQYLDGMPEVRSVPDEIEDVKFYLRSKLRDAGKSEEKIKATKENYMKSFGVPESWFDGTFDKVQTMKDSTFSADLDLVVEDLQHYSSNARFIMLDACFTGSFHLDDYLSGNYIFDEGNTLVLQANTVNAYQDKWPDEMAGLLGLGMRIGFWNRMNCSLETHLIGDPTFAFVPADGKIKINDWLFNNKNNNSFWKKQLSSPYADVQALALRMIFEHEGVSSSGLLMNFFKNSPWWTVRAEALKLLGICRDKNYTEAINLGISDSYELIRRLCAIQMGNSGNPSHIPYLIGTLLRNNVSKRVEYDLKTSLGMFDKSLLQAELAKQITEKEFLLNPEESRATLAKTIEYNCNRNEQDVKDLFSEKTSKKEKLFNLRSFRNITVHQHLDQLIGFTDTVTDKDLKLTAIEMLGWFDQSWQREKIVIFCDKELAKSNLPEIYRNEVLKTKNRVQ
jgi:hypothetical protein